MFQYLLLLFLLATFSLSKALGCCFGGTMNTVRFLQEQGGEVRAVRIIVDSIWVDHASTYLARVHVLEQYAGEAMPKTFTLSTGQQNTCISGREVKPGEEYVVFAYSLSSQHPTRYGALSGCDSHSYGPINYAGKQKCDRRFDQLEAALTYMNLVQKKHSGRLVLRECSGKIIAIGKLKRGVIYGRWRYYAPKTYQPVVKNDFAEDGQLQVQRVYHSKYKSFKYLAEKLLISDNERMLFSYTSRQSAPTIRITMRSSNFGMEVVTCHQIRHDQESVRVTKSTIEYPGGQLFPHGDFARITPAGDSLEAGHYWYGARVGRWVVPISADNPASATRISNYTYPDTLALSQADSCFTQRFYSPEGELRQQIEACDSLQYITTYAEYDNSIHKKTYRGKDGLILSQQWAFTSAGQRYLIFEGAYHLRHRVGPHLHYDSSGQVIQQLVYDSLGRMHGRQINGQIDHFLRTGNYHHGRPIGIHEHYYHSGTLGQQIVYAQDLQSAVLKEYDANGDLILHIQVLPPSLDTSYSHLGSRYIGDADEASSTAIRVDWGGNIW